MRILPVGAAAALLTLTAAQNISSTNAPDAFSDPQFRLFGGNVHNKDRQDLGQLKALTKSAAETVTAPTGWIDSVTSTDSANFSNIAIAYISCDSDSSGNNQAVDTIRAVRDQRLIAAVLYSTSAATCQFENPGDLDDFSVYTFGSSENSTNLLQLLQKGVPGIMYLALVERQDGNNNRSGPLAGSPSTAVAMIILYSITGVITALFLIIILTGAIRAHRHPERYGPRDVTGRPRQSRARGLARAMLDTIPIVKFGENDTSKPTDVELADGTKRNNSQGSSTHAENSGAGVGGSVSATDQTKSEENHGIAPAEQRNTEPAPAIDESGLECSICADEFEKGQDVRVLPCNHKFHAGCVDQWLLNVSGTCPLCRIDLRARNSEEGDENDSNRRSGSLAPPLEEHDGEHVGADRRRSAFMLLLHRGDESSTEDRIAALRRLRQRNSVAEASNGEHEDGQHSTRRQRLAARLQQRFGIRTRHAGQETSEAAASTEHPAPVSTLHDIPERREDTQTTSTTNLPERST